MRNVRFEIGAGEVWATSTSAGYVRISLGVFGDDVTARDYTNVFFGPEGVVRDSLTVVRAADKSAKAGAMKKGRNASRELHQEVDTKVFRHARDDYGLWVTVWGRAFLPRISQSDRDG